MLLINRLNKISWTKKKKIKLRCIFIDVFRIILNITNYYFLKVCYIHIKWILCKNSMKNTYFINNKKKKPKEMNLSFLQKNIKLLFSLLDRIFYIFLNNYILEHHQRDFIIEFQILHNFYNLCLMISHHSSKPRIISSTFSVFLLIKLATSYEKWRFQEITWNTSQGQ
jgi:hypothetical protein